MYVNERGTNSFRNCIDRVASLFGKQGRPYVELWEVDSTFYPTGYPNSVPQFTNV